MLEYIQELLTKEGIRLSNAVPLSACRVVRPYLLERCGICDGSAVLFAIPYYTPACDGPHTVSAYAVPRDYHLYISELSSRILPQLESAFPQTKFAMFADHSPIDELHAAAIAGLGVLGKNRMLLTQPYSSFVFLAEIITDATIPCQAGEIHTCTQCGTCVRTCGFLAGTETECLSALTQKKGELTPEEAKRIVKSGCVWGCDNCQEVCPYTVDAKRSGTIYSEIPFFREQNLPWPNAEALRNMTDREFAERAYSWRGRKVILRNLSLNDTNTETEDKQCSN